MNKTSIHRKRLIVLLIVTLISLPASGGVGDILTLLNTITSTLRGEIGKVLSAIQSVRTTKRMLEQEVVWPVNQINQARASAVQIRTQFTSLTRSIETLPVTSAMVSRIRSPSSSLMAKAMSVSSSGFTLPPPQRAAWASFAFSILHGRGSRYATTRSICVQATLIRSAPP